MNDKILKKLQKKELEILKEVDRICQKHNIKYSIAYGTAIGAVRHKGFIPWDDDIDIMMTIDQYKKFQEVVEKELDKERFYYQNFKKEKHGYLMWDKIRMNNTTCIIKGDESIPIHYGIMIDIFPLVKLPRSAKKQQKNYNLIKKATMILEIELYNYKLKDVKLLGKLFYFFLNFIPRNLRKKIANSYLEKVFNYDGEFDDYADYSEFYKKVHCYPKEMFNKIEKIKFENEEFPIIKDYDSYLKLVYGDYMKLPPKSQRNGHGNLIVDFEKEFKISSYLK